MSARTLSAGEQLRGGSGVNVYPTLLAKVVQVSALPKECILKTSFRFVSILVVLAMSAGSAAPGQTAGTARLMREKLTHSQKILEAIMTSDFAALEQHSVALARATESPAWSVLKSHEYQQQSTAFLRAIQDLVEAAKQRDLDAAGLDYVSMTLTCLQCHRSIRNARIAAR
jgi:hypothetical protein